MRTQETNLNSLKVGELWEPAFVPEFLALIAANGSVGWSTVSIQMMKGSSDIISTI